MPATSIASFRSVAEELGIREVKFTGAKSAGGIDEGSPSLRRNQSKCILCRSCVSVCQNIQTVTALFAQGRGFESKVAPAFDESINDVACTNCGQCSLVCPVGAITEKSSIRRSLGCHCGPHEIRRGPGCPCSTGGLGRGIRISPGTLVTGKMLSAVREARFRPRVRHQLHRRPHHHRGRQRTDQTDQRRRYAAADYKLQPRMDQVYRALLSRPAASSLHMQISAADAGRPGKDLFCRERGH